MYFFLIGKVEIGASCTKLLQSPPEEETKPPKPKKPKILDKYETEETKNLTTSELQRLVLLEHLELIRLQKARLRENSLINVFSEEIL